MEEYSVEELRALNEEEIKKLFLEVRSKLFSKNLEENVKKDLEIYYCYIYKELQSRSL